MANVKRRVYVNILTLIVFTVAIVSISFLTFVTGILFDDSYRVSVTIPDAGGVLGRQEVTVMGRSVGIVEDAQLVEGGVRLDLSINGAFEVPNPADVRVLRRSPVGEQAVELTPPASDGTRAGWEAAEPGDDIALASEPQLPATVVELLETTVDLFNELDPQNTGIVVRELATALDGRADVIRQLNEEAIDFGETILEGRPDIERLLATSEPLLEMLDDHAADLEDLFENGAELADVLASNRPNLETLLRTGPLFLEQAETMIINTRANIQCLSEDLIAVNEMLLGPTTSDGLPSRFYETKLDEVQMAIDKHRFFFQQGIPLALQEDPLTGMGWARVEFVLSELSSGDRYPEKIATPPTLPGAACESDPWGTGVNAVRQEDAQPPTITSPGIMYAPLVEEAGAGQVEPPSTTPDASADVGRDVPLPATGGGLAALAAVSTLAAFVARRRR